MFFRVIKFGLQDMLRNVSLSLMTVVMLTLMLLSMNVLVSIRALTDKAVQTVKDQIDVSIYFRPNVTVEQVDEIKNHLKAFPEVVTTTYFTKEEVLSKFKQAHQLNKQILASLDELGENPLGATLVVKTKEPKDYAKIITALNVPEYEKIIEEKTFSTTANTIDRIHIITYNVQKFVLMLGVLFAIISLLVIFNTIRVAIYTHRMEIAIKKLVGATNWFIRGPYVVQAFLFSLFSVALTLGIILFSVRFVDPYVGVIFGEYSFLTNYFLTHILLLFSAELAAVFLLTLLTTTLATRKYLRV